MTVPTQSFYPDSLDTEDNLFLVHDSLRLRLARDYNPGDTTILVEGDPAVLRRFPGTGLITLTEQCSEVDLRALSFYYSGIDYDAFTFSRLELLEDFIDRDSIKPKRITNVTQNVMSKHHNLIKDAVIAIERFIGIKGTEDRRPLGETMEGRINFLRRLVLSPKAYFTVDRTIGLVPMTVTFTDLSFRLATDNANHTVDFLWDFGDNTASTVSLVSVSNVVPSCAENILLDDLDGGGITKTYCTPGIYDVTLTVANEYGSDSITIPSLINARVQAPDSAVVLFVPSDAQTVVPESWDGEDQFTPPSIRSAINTLITMQIPLGPNPHNPGHSYAGELLTGSNAVIDPVAAYTWSLADDLSHATAIPSTRASYSVGGLYDMKVRVDTAFGAYRITTYPASIDIVERTNLWMFNYSNGSGPAVTAFEYGLISETFKTLQSPSLIPSVDDSFLDSESNEAQMKQEFVRNTGFAPRSTLGSGAKGDVMLFYATGRSDSDPISAEQVKFVSFNGFAETYNETMPGMQRPWNWANFNSAGTSYFLLGTPTTAAGPFLSPANPTLSLYDIGSGNVVSSTLTSSNFGNGGETLLTNPATFGGAGENVYGNFSVYRTAFKNNVGYLLRNENVGDFFRIQGFYRTQGTVGSPVQTLTKLANMAGPSKVEGQLVSLTPGLFFFNNSGSISAFNDAGGIWETTGPGVNSIAFRELQDQVVAEFDDDASTLLAVSDGDQRAYLSYDYSVRAFIKFNALNLTFSSLSNRPPGRQWIAGIY